VPSDYGTEVEFIPHERIEGDKVAWSIRRGNVIFAAVGGDDYRRGSATSPAQGMLALELFDPTHHNYYGFFPASDAPRIYEEVKAGTVDDDGMPHRYEEIRDAAADMRLLSHMTHRMLYNSAQNHTRYQNASPTPSAGVRVGSRSLVSAKLPTWLRGHPYRTLLYATKKEARDAGHHPSTLAFVETMMGNVAVAIMQHESVLTRDGFWVSLVHDPARYPDTVRKRNDATSAVAGLTAAEPWAFAQYDDTSTGSMERAIGETNRRRAKQIAYNTAHGITPQTIKKQIKDIVGDIAKARERAVKELATLDAAAYEGSKAKLIKAKRKEMHEAADNLDFETAALLRDEIAALEQADVKKKK
jgi:hypothetical protein